MDRGSVLGSSSEIAHDLKPEIMHQIINSKKDKKIKVNQWIWYAAAAILMIGFIVGRLTMPLNQTEPIDTGNITLSQLLASEDWTKLESVLTNHNEFNKYASDQISINTLLDKLLVLRRMGVEKISIVSNSAESRTDENVYTKNHPDIMISLSDFIQLLQQARQQRSQISLADVSDILSTI